MLDLGLGVLCEVVSPKSSAFNGWDCTDWLQVIWALFNEPILTLTSHNFCIYVNPDTKAHFTLRWRSPPVMNSRRNLKFDWRRVTLLSGGGLHYGQESFGLALCTWIKNWRDCQRGDMFLKGSPLEVKFLEQPQSLKQETWPLENSNLNKIFFPISVYSLVVSSE